MIKVADRKIYNIISELFVNSIRDDNTDKDIISYINEGGDIDYQNKNEYTALHNAVIYNKYYRVEYLLIKGANPDIKNERGYTPLMIAVEDYNLGMICLLIRYGASIGNVSKCESATFVKKFKQLEKVYNNITMGV